MTRIRENMKVILAVAIAALALTAAGATAAALITSKDIKNGTIKKADLNKSVKKALKKKGAPGPAGQQGPQGEPGPASPATYTNPDWAVMHRNVIGSPTAELGGSIEPPPYGEGALNLSLNGVPRTDTNGAEQVTFGTETGPFPVATFNEVTALGFSVYTTDENNARGNPNMPAIKFEVDPNLAATPSNFSTLQFLPANTPRETWTTIDATTAPADPAGYGFFLSGAAGTATGCKLATPCTFTQIKNALNDGGDGATILSLGVGKGRDYAFSGAVDGLRVNGTVFDFEPFGVQETTP